MKTLFAATALSLVAGAAAAQMANPMVGGAEMPATNNIVENAVNSADHTTLVAAVQAAELVETLSGEGPFTVFAPTNDAFAALPAGTVESLVEPQNKDRLTQILTCHVVAGEVFSTDLVAMIEADGGSHAIETVGGCTITASVQDGMVMLTDEQGRMSTVTIADVDQSNGVIHVIDDVILPAADAQN
ncbi:fasciclin domain-containing protein [Rubellimicrobium roseum]|uniref:Fasciclin domain-containing protein n=1 Tax=Rubellimicrobium roseum TaxID=687525 RepID=A0A5C4NPS1_9RHOB|nr:fasciclin domain-containing protein [Rubellimicrobium roseum]TNC74637.1 fasciclin domain-containing protein [Rubellimicrobium roseum]